MNTVLEILQEAEASIQRAQILNGEIPDKSDLWRFSEWTTCTCGHIYAAAVGAKTGQLDKYADSHLVELADTDGLDDDTDSAVREWSDLSDYPVSHEQASLYRGALRAVVEANKLNPFHHDLDNPKEPLYMKVSSGTIALCDKWYPVSTRLPDENPNLYLRRTARRMVAAAIRKVEADQVAAMEQLSAGC